MFFKTIYLNNVFAQCFVFLIYTSHNHSKELLLNATHNLQDRFLYLIPLRGVCIFLRLISESKDALGHFILRPRGANDRTHDRGVHINANVRVQ